MIIRSTATVIRRLERTKTELRRLMKRKHDLPTVAAVATSAYPPMQSDADPANVLTLLPTERKLGLLRADFEWTVMRFVLALVCALAFSFAMIRASAAQSMMWVPKGVGDCPGNDFDCSAGSQPDPARCNSRTIGSTAVCWLDRPTGYPPFPACQGKRRWCTYKPMRAAACTGGGAPGNMYECTAAGWQSQKLPMVGLSAEMNAEEFVKMCSSQGLRTKISKELSCADFIALQVGAVVATNLEAKESVACTALSSQFNNDAFFKRPSDHPVVKGVFNWLRARTDSMREKTIIVGVFMAVGALYECR